MKTNSIIPAERIDRAILFIRGQKVMLDRDIAELYGVKTIALRQQVKRNRGRFPEDFMFRLTEKEAEFLVSQNVIPSRKSFGGSLPFVFTQEGVAMLSGVLKCKRAVHMNILIMRAFVRLRDVLSSHKDLVQKLAELEAKFIDHDEKLFELLTAIRKLMYPPVPRNKRKIGFRLDS